jgi:hypothetical protein
MCWCLRPVCSAIEARHAVAVNHDVGIGRIVVKRLADHNAGLAVLGSLTKEAYGRRYREIAGHLPPDVLELILFGPDVSPGPRDFVLASRCVKLRSSFEGGVADVAGMGKATEISGLREARSGQHASDPQFTHVKILSGSVRRPARCYWH